MKKIGISAYIVPSTDPHQSEYTPAFWQRRQFLSGFTGSVGDIIVTQKKACLWTDSRYYLQAEEQLDGTPFELKKQGLKDVPSMKKWLTQELEKGQIVGIDADLVTLKGYDDYLREFKKSEIKIKLLNKNLVDEIWVKDRPEFPCSQINRQPTRFAGQSAKTKIQKLRKDLKKQEVDALVITRLDSIAWLFNIRGNDVDFIPLVVSYGLLTQDQAFLFVQPEKCSESLRKSLAPLIEVKPYDSIWEELKVLGKEKKTVWVDAEAASARIGRALKGAKLLRKASPIPKIKARKNSTEIKGIKAAHLRDGVALVRFFSWLEKTIGKEKVTEISAAEKLETFREAQELYKGPSFRTISAYGSHGAIVHYAPTPESDKTLRPNGLYLLDSGGQYLDGTTDVTRTILLGGKPTKEQKDQFTRVLKGHIALSQTKFPAGVSGQRLDAFARRSLWQVGLDYGHGTGHGVGAYLSVHESPPGVAPARLLTVPLEEGHVLSNEPGYYKTGKYGIRTENLVLVVRDQELSKPKSVFLKFENLTFCPIDTRLIQKDLLEDSEIEWLNEYHATVAEKLTPLLNKKDAQWLRKKTRAI